MALPIQHHCIINACTIRNAVGSIVAYKIVANLEATTVVSLRGLPKPENANECIVNDALGPFIG